MADSHMNTRWERLTARLLHKYRHTQAQQRAARAAFADRVARRRLAESRNTRRRLCPHRWCRDHTPGDHRTTYICTLGCGAIR